MIELFINKIFNHSDKLIALSMLILIGIAIRFTLQMFGQSWIKTKAHTTTILVLPIITYVITNVISGNIALSLGMVGALSIVRFRNPVRSPLELSVYFGSRSHKNSNVKSKFYRKIIGNLLRYLIFIFLKIKIRDTQCGFKLYKSAVAKKIFSRLKFFGYEHDIEIILLLKKFKIYIAELPVTWKHVKLSKVNIILDPIKIFFKVFLIKIKYLG